MVSCIIGATVPQDASLIDITVTWEPRNKINCSIYASLISSVAHQMVCYAMYESIYVREMSEHSSGTIIGATVLQDASI